MTISEIKNYILNNLITKSGGLSPGFYRKYLKNKLNSFELNLYNEIITFTFFLNNKSFPLCCYHIVNDLYYEPLCICGKKLRFKNFKRGMKNIVFCVHRKPLRNKKKERKQI